MGETCACPSELAVQTRPVAAGVLSDAYLFWKRKEMILQTLSLGLAYHLVLCECEMLLPLLQHMANEQP